MRKKRQFKAGRRYHQGSRVAHRAFFFDGAKTYAYDYHVDGQLARADYGNGKAEDFGWDGLALIKRGDERFVNEPHVGGGNPVASSKGTKYFNDILGTTLGAKHGKYTPAALTAFGETIENGTVRSTSTPSTYTSFYTGKPEVAGLGHAFLFRNYRASLGKWQTADPFGYPDGWNPLAYGPNSPGMGVDLLGAVWDNGDFVDYYFKQDSSRPNYIDTDQMELTGAIQPVVRNAATDKIDSIVRNLINGVNQDSGQHSFRIDKQPFSVACGSIVWAMGGGTGRATGQITYNWWIEYVWYADHLYERKMYYWNFVGELQYFDSFKDPLDVLNLIKKDIEVPFGRPYDYGHVWSNQSLSERDYLWARMIE